MSAIGSLIEISEISRQFRRAIEKTDRRYLPETFANFPNGSCGDAALLLGAHLRERGYGIFNYMLGERGRGSERNWTSHGWVEQAGIIVDITAGQFPDSPQDVIVSRESDWHQQFNGEVQHEARFDVYDRRTEQTLRNAYDLVVENFGTAN